MLAPPPSEPGEWSVPGHPFSQLETGARVSHSQRSAPPTEQGNGQPDGHSTAESAGWSWQYSRGLQFFPIQPQLSPRVRPHIDPCQQPGNSLNDVADGAPFLLLLRLRLLDSLMSSLLSSQFRPCKTPRSHTPSRKGRGSARVSVRVRAGRSQRILCEIRELHPPHAGHETGGAITATAAGTLGPPPRACGCRLQFGGCLSVGRPWATVVTVSIPAGRRAGRNEIVDEKRQHPPLDLKVRGQWPVEYPESRIESSNPRDRSQCAGRRNERLSPWPFTIRARLRARRVRTGTSLNRANVLHHQRPLLDLRRLSEVTRNRHGH